MSLHAAIDDATGKVVSTVFRRQEDLKGYFMITQQMIKQEGIPLSLYSGRHSIFCSRNEKQTIEQELAGEPVPLSQFGQALQALGITHIKAMTPQAKGRVERLFQTLQDRWVIKLRIRGIHTMETRSFRSWWTSTTNNLLLRHEMTKVLLYPFRKNSHWL